MGEVGEKEKLEALNAARQADFLVIVFDTIQGIKKTEQDLFLELEQLNKPYVVVLNKADLVKKELGNVTQQAARNLHLEPHQVIPVIAKEGKQIDQVIIAIARGRSRDCGFAWECNAPFSLAVSLAGYRQRSFSICCHCPVAAARTRFWTSNYYTVYHGPGNCQDLQYRVTTEPARELVATFGLGFIGRILFQELSKLGGLPGWFLAALVASSTTIAMGYAASIWFERGKKLRKKKSSRFPQA